MWFEFSSTCSVQVLVTSFSLAFFTFFAKPPAWSGGCEVWWCSSTRPSSGWSNTIPSPCGWDHMNWAAWAWRDWWRITVPEQQQVQRWWASKIPWPEMRAVGISTDISRHIQIHPEIRYPSLQAAGLLSLFFWVHICYNRHWHQSVNGWRTRQVGGKDHDSSSGLSLSVSESPAVGLSQDFLRAISKVWLKSSRLCASLCALHIAVSMSLMVIDLVLNSSTYHCWWKPLLKSCHCYPTCWRHGIISITEAGFKETVTWDGFLYVTGPGKSWQFEEVLL